MCKDKEKLLKRARHKFISKGLANRLYFENPESILSKPYFGSRLCCNELQQQGKTLVSRYCNQRWCLVCNRIRTAKLICEYFDQIGKFTDAQFVTLTVKTVDGEGLAASMANMASVWRNITNMARRKRTDFKGVRKAECTIRPGGLYHYHFHLVVEGRENAEWLINAWLQRMGPLATLAAQDMRSANEQSLKELFKYFTKLSTKDANGKKVLFDFKRMDTIFCAMRGKRVFQPFGGLRAVTEEIDKISSQEYENLEDGFRLWKWYSEDWINEVGECLTGYHPLKNFEELLKEANRDVNKPLNMGSSLLIV
jgi:hypothetical protein